MDISDKISIINALMQEDRVEIRSNKGVIVNTTYFVVSGIIAVSAFAISINKPEHFPIYIIGIWSLFFLYLSTFMYFKKHLYSLRQCLEIREKYFKIQGYLEEENPFKPLKEIEEGNTPSYASDYMYFLPLIAFLVAAANTGALLVIF